MYSTVEQEYTLKVRTNKGKLITEKFTKDFEVWCNVSKEECHGYHDVITPDEEELEMVVNDYLENLTTKEAVEIFSNSPELFEDNEFIVELVEAI